MESSSKLGGALFFIFFLNSFDNKSALQLQLARWLSVLSRFHFYVFLYGAFTFIGE
jgi:hypothetical protein